MHVLEKVECRDKDTNGRLIQQKWTLIADTEFKIKNKTVET